jgi:hypothetical protein
VAISKHTSQNFQYQKICAETATSQTPRSDKLLRSMLRNILRNKNYKVKKYILSNYFYNSTFTSLL